MSVLHALHLAPLGADCRTCSRRGGKVGRTCYSVHGTPMAGFHTPRRSDVGHLSADNRATVVGLVAQLGDARRRRRGDDEQLILADIAAVLGGAPAPV